MRLKGRVLEEVALKIDDCVGQMAEYHLDHKRSPLLEVVHVYATERAFQENDPLNVKAWRIRPSELLEHVGKALEIGAEICVNRWEEEKILTIIRRANGYIAVAEYSLKV